MSGIKKIAVRNNIFLRQSHFSKLYLLLSNHEVKVYTYTIADAAFCCATNANSVYLYKYSAYSILISAKVVYLFYKTNFSPQKV